MKKNLTLGWFCSYTPEELFRAAGYETTRLNSDEKNVSLGEAYLPTNFCPYLKNNLGGALANKKEALTGYIFANCCDGLRRLADVFKYSLNDATCYLIDVPHLKTDAAIEYFKSNLESVKKDLERNNSIQISDVEIKEQIEFFNQIRSELNEIDKLRESENPIVSGSQFFNLINNIMSSPKSGALKKITEFKNRLNENSGVNAKSWHKAFAGTKIYLSGNILDRADIIDIIEESGGVVVGDDLCTGSRYFENLVQDMRNPIEALAERYLKRSPCARMYSPFERFEKIKRGIKSRGAQKVIFITVKFCDCSLYEFPALKRELAALEVPILMLESDCTASSFGQIRTRVQAFLESG
ncbi:MAG: 2-hydroxyacyl-CoA dehydratase family protein [Actinobacteria bacterium]|nr:2-hydroxyacyl-CoA dehydratase family protein [Actinomycetota bacterium]